jgi:drug/metabolite transporter (DMT)-like permease
MKASWVPASLAVIASILAQISLQRAAKSSIFTPPWFVWMGCAVSCYGGSLLAYWRTLQHYPISRIGPIVTVAVVLGVFVYGACIGESVGGRQYTGLALAIGAIFFLAH